MKPGVIIRLALLVGGLALLAGRADAGSRFSTPRTFT
jgi:hypothetical protein